MLFFNLLCMYNIHAKRLVVLQAKRLVLFTVTNTGHNMEHGQHPKIYRKRNIMTLRRN